MFYVIVKYIYKGLCRFGDKKRYIKKRDKTFYHSFFFCWMDRPRLRQEHPLNLSI